MVCNTRQMLAGLLVAVLASGPVAAQPAPGSTLSAPLGPQGTAPVLNQTPASLGGPQDSIPDVLPPARFVPPVQGTALPPQMAAPARTVQPAVTPPSQPGGNPVPYPATTAPWTFGSAQVTPASSGLTPLFGGSPQGTPCTPNYAHCNPNEDSNGSLLKGDPLLDDPPWAPPGWFAGLETQFVASHIENKLGSTISNGDFIHLPTADLAWNVSPRIEVGYRFGEGAGELLLAYKFLITAGSQPVPAFDAAGNSGDLHSHLNINAWDLDYGSREYSLLPNWDMKWRIGVRLAAVFFDSTATSPLLEQRELNNFVGAGPHIGLDLRRAVKGTGLEFFTRLENAWLIGDTDQSYQEIPVGGVGGASRFLSPLVVPWLSVEAGLGWTPPDNDHLYFAAGYTWETWWNLADAGGVPGPTAVITNQGVFFRIEVRY
jgi:hypothetical protein